MISSINEAIRSVDQLSEETFDFILNYREEDTQIDYKESFHVEQEREWLEITKDIMAFANSNGGFLLFGVRDGTFEQIGLDSQVIRILGDSNNIIQKINRFVDPPISILRCKSYLRDNKNFVAVFIPPSLGRTHIISRDGGFKLPSGEAKIVLRMGTTYVRRSGGNHLADSRDLDDIINRRIEHYKSSLLDRIARVVEAPQESEVFVVSQDQETETHRKFVIKDAPDSIPVKGMSFTISPETREDEIMAWIAMSRKEEKAVPSAEIIWKWYRERKSLNLTADQKIHVAKFCLLNDCPVFFWIKDLEAKTIQTMLIETLSLCRLIDNIGKIISVSAFLGEKFHQFMINRLDKNLLKRLSRNNQVFPTQGPRSLFQTHLDTFNKQNFGKIKNEDLEIELNEIAGSAKGSQYGQPALSTRWRATSLDCFLYAQDDQYLKKIPTKSGTILPEV